MKDIIYCDIDENACAWTANLIKSGEIPDGEVWCRDIMEIGSEEIKGVRQLHLFNGISGWALAIKIANFPEDKRVITGSCPCQGFSTAGKQKGFDDPRDLWPHMFRLGSESGFDFWFGEQVAAAIKHGWLDRVQSNLEAKNYAVGHCVLGAHSVGANHIRQRLYWGATLGPVRKPAADGREVRRDVHGELRGEGLGEGCDPMRLGQNSDGLGRGRGRDGDTSGNDGQVQAPGLRAIGGVSDGSGERRLGLDPLLRKESGRRGPQNISKTPGGGTLGRLPDDSRSRRIEGPANPSGHGEGEGEARQATGRSAERGADGLLADDKRRELEGLIREPGANHQDKGGGVSDDIAGCGPERESPWNDCRIIPCTDGRARRIAPAILPLAYAWPKGRDMGESGSRIRRMVRDASRSRIGMLKGSGNAIVPALAAEFIMAFMEAL